MDHLQANNIAQLLEGYSTLGRAKFALLEQFAPGELFGFHQWANERPCEGAFLFESASNEALWVVLVDSNRSGNYYAVLFPRSKAGPIAEIHELTDNAGEIALHWKYTPTKHDKKNPERQAYFAKVFLTNPVTISVPTDADQVDDFLAELFSLVECRLKADELDENKPLTRDGFPEGKLKERLHLSRERNSEVVRLAKANAQSSDGRLRCACCGFDFHDKYGELGSGYIEAHHTKPVSELHEAGETTRVEDLALVCSNCHRMLHRRRPWLGLNELTQLLKIANPAPNMEPSRPTTPNRLASH